MRLSFFAALMRFRLLPITMVFLVMLFGIKTYDFIQGTNRLSEMLIAGSAEAVEDDDLSAQPKKSAADAQKPEEGKAADKDAADGKEDGEPKEMASLPEKEDDVIVGGDKEEASDAGSAPEEKKQFTKVELDILQNLSKRRAELDKYEEEVKMKESLLEATELRINKKIDEIKNLQGSVKKILDEYKKQEDSNVRSLVKMYENMKPKDAARIFNEIEMPVLMLIVDRMSERKAAPILASMDPKKAKQLTIELAEERKVLNDSEEALEEVR